MVHRVLDTLEQQVVLFTHDLDLLTAFDRVLVVDDGRIVYDGLPADAVAHYTYHMHDRLTNDRPTDDR
jgi:biotin transport system ATP-binding protein